MLIAGLPVGAAEPGALKLRGRTLMGPAIEIHAEREVGVVDDHDLAVGAHANVALEAFGPVREGALERRP
jgi:hypothetical protein